MNRHEIIQETLSLNPAERLLVIEGVLKSLDEPDQKIDMMWAAEAEQRLHAYREGRLDSVSLEEAFKEQ